MSTTFLFAKLFESAFCAKFYDFLVVVAAKAGTTVGQ